MKPSLQKHVIVDTDEEFDRTLNEHAVEVDLASKDEETAYEQLDSRIANELQSLMADSFGESNDGVLYHQNFDWWPTKTRFLYLDSLCITWDLIHRIQSLLTGAAEDWRINVHISTPLDGDDAQEIGAINIYRDWLLIQKTIRDLLPTQTS